jgi:hypothetical protein
MNGTVNTSNGSLKRLFAKSDLLFIKCLDITLFLFISNNISKIDSFVSSFFSCMKQFMVHEHNNIDETSI